jgi:hypothetical protein
MLWRLSVAEANSINTTKMKTEEILKGYDAAIKEAENAPKKYLEKVIEDFNIKLSMKEDEIDGLKETIESWDQGDLGKEITDFLPEHLNNIRYASAIEAIFENIERIPIETLEALAKKDYSLIN